MRASNSKVKNWLLQNGFTDIWFKPHTKRHDLVYTQQGNYRSLDLWNLFDGICFHVHGYIVLLQMKTNSWAKSVPIENFLKNKMHLKVMSFNVTDKRKECNGKYRVFVRCYE